MWVSKLEFAVGRKGIQFSLSCPSVHRPIKTLTLPTYLSLFHLSFPRLLYLFISQADIDSSLLSPMSQFSSAQSLSRVQLFATPWTAARQASLSITNSRSSLKLTSIESVMPSSHLILCRPLLLLPPIPVSIRVFSNESTLHMRWPKYWSFSFSIIPSKEHPGLISFKMDWLDLLAVQGTLKSLLQHSSKASILQHSAFFTIDTFKSSVMTNSFTGRDWNSGSPMRSIKMGTQWKQCQALYFWAPKSLQMVIAAMKLKDTYSLEEKLWPT